MERLFKHNDGVSGGTSSHQGAVSDLVSLKARLKASGYNSQMTQYSTKDKLHLLSATVSTTNKKKKEYYSKHILQNLDLLREKQQVYRSVE